MENEEIKKELLGKWLKAKAKEEKANAERVELEKEIEELYASSLPVEGSITIKEDGFKVNLKREFSYSLDTDKYIQLIPEIPEELRPHKLKFELDKKGWQYLLDNKQNDVIGEVYKLVSPLVTIKPRKTAIKIERL